MRAARTITQVFAVSELFKIGLVAKLRVFRGRRIRVRAQANRLSSKMRRIGARSGMAMGSCTGLMARTMKATGS